MVAEVLNCLFLKTVEINLLKGTILGKDMGQISHLQFGDNMILFLEPKLDYVRVAKRIFRCFELVSGLKINFHKSCILQIGKRRSLANKTATVFRCKNEILPNSYLGLPLGANPNLKACWDPILAKIEKRLAPWKMRFLSKDGRLALIKTVLSNIPTYFLSVFRIPMGVAKKIKKLQRDFFRGDGIEKRRIHSVD
ncbi:hypothetical protein Ddye_032239 [Dipteronia dyeriana]|uniref:Reverse transcriptase domain-containing protein n=1 Tax=Dipteronia dyeriana TaxID=168575 RepID=A0AAD9TJV7_9ROSI|nr:hypothetical protein Ddye_032239 [Dipteronia dyeriana]